MQQKRLPGRALKSARLCKASCSRRRLSWWTCTPGWTRHARTLRGSCGSTGNSPGKPELDARCSAAAVTERQNQGRAFQALASEQDTALYLQRMKVVQITHTTVVVIRDWARS